MTDDFSGRQLCALALCAMIAPAVQYCAAVPWPWVLAAAALAAAYYIYIACMGGRLPQHLEPTAVARFALGRTGGAMTLGLAWLWTVLAAAAVCRGSVSAFPDARAFPLVPLVALYLAWRAADGGEAVVCRTGGVLVLPVLALLAAALAFGTKNVTAANLVPSGSWRDAAGPFAVFLLPSGVFALRRVEKGSGAVGWFLTGTFLAAACSVVTIGCLGAPLAAASENAFYLMSKSVSVFGVMERFEVLASAALMLSRTCLLAVLLAQGARLGKELLPVLPPRGGAAAAALAAFGLLWVVPAVPTTVLFWGGVVFWGFLPAVLLGVASLKKV